ncbi:MAG: hypothetical protein MJE77_44320, partial [Proteobacteria bacterium]|nr:hypothetical protein [Pseudomonadota bacterium]
GILGLSIDTEARCSEFDRGTELLSRLYSPGGQRMGAEKRIAFLACVRTDELMKLPASFSGGIESREAKSKSNC